MSRAQILSVVTVVDRQTILQAETVYALHQHATSLGVALELVLVLNGCDASVVEAAREQARRLPDLQIYVLKRPVDLTTALLAGLENAVGDWVVTVDFARDDPGVVADLYRAGTESGAELALALPEGRSHSRSIFDAILSRAFHRTFRLLHGYSLAQHASTARMLSRAVLNSVLRHDAPLVALHTLGASGGHRQATVSTKPRPAPALAVPERVRSRWQVLIGINAVPLRLANLLCGVGATIATLYSVYVVAIYLFKSDVMPGWTTVSLMLSGMFLLLSLVLWLLSEYLILVLDAGARRPRYELSEEFSSGAQTRRRHLNVEAEL